MIRHRFVDAGGLRVHLAEAGAEGAPPVLALHGWPQTAHLWREVAVLLAADHHVLMPDLRGFGASEAPGHGMDPETFAADQVALLDALGLERVRVIGHDWGGYAGFLLAARHPERVVALLACNTPAPWVRVSPRVLAGVWRGWYAAVLASPLGPPLLRRTGLVRRAIARETGGRGVTEADLDLFAGALRAPERARATQLLYRSYLRIVVAALAPGDRVPPLRVPAHLLFGERDSAISRSLVEGFPGLEYADAGHFVVDEQPGLVVRRARELFASAS